MRRPAAAFLDHAIDQRSCIQARPNQSNDRPMQGNSGLSRGQIAEPHVGLRNLLATLADDQLSPAALATRRVITDVARQLVNDQQWPGATQIEES